MKTCTNCGNVNNNKRGYCSACKQEYNASWYQKNKEKHKKAVHANRVILREKYKEIIKSAKNVPCADCGVSYPYYVMDFDHIKEKSFLVSRAAGIGISEDRLI